MAHVSLLTALQRVSQCSVSLLIECTVHCELLEKSVQLEGTLVYVGSEEENAIQCTCGYVSPKLMKVFRKKDTLYFQSCPAC